MKILVIQLSRFGDALQTTPMLCALRRRYPQATITVLSRHNVLKVYQSNPDIDFLELFDIEEFCGRLAEKPERIFVHYLELKKAVTRLKEKKFDLVINTTHDRFSTFLGYLLDAPNTQGMCLSESKKPQILTNGFWFRYLKCTSKIRKTAPFNLADIYKNAVGGDARVRDLFFYSDSASSRKGRSLLDQKNQGGNDRYVAFQMGASTQERCWPRESFAALGDMLNSQKGIQVVFLGTDNERWLGEEVSRLMRTKPINLIGKTDLFDLAGVLEACALLVTNDTGTMHLAGALRTTCIALFFESANPFQTGPYGEGHIVCAPELDCFPCPTNGTCAEKRCLETIPVQTVFDLVLYKLGDVSKKAVSPPSGRIYETLFDETGAFDAIPLVRARMGESDLARSIYRFVWLEYHEDLAMQGNSARRLAPSTGFVGDKENASNNLLPPSFDDNSCLSGQNRAFASGLRDGKPIHYKRELANGYDRLATCYDCDNHAIRDWLTKGKEDLDTLVSYADKGIALLKDVERILSTSPFDAALLTTKSNEIGMLDKKIGESAESSLWIGQLAFLFSIELVQVDDDHFSSLLATWQNAYSLLRFRTTLLQKQIGLATDFFANRHPYTSGLVPNPPDQPGAKVLPSCCR